MKAERVRKDKRSAIRVWEKSRKHGTVQALKLFSHVFRFLALSKSCVENEIVHTLHATRRATDASAGTMRPIIRPARDRTSTVLHRAKDGSPLSNNAVPSADILFDHIKRFRLIVIDVAHYSRRPCGRGSPIFGSPRRLSSMSAPYPDGE